MSFTGAVMAQEAPVQPETNAEIVSGKINGLLQQSRIIQGIDFPFHLGTNFPDRFTLAIYQRLISFEKQVLSGHGSPSLELRVHPENAIRQLDRRTAERTLKGELHLILTDGNSVILETEKLGYEYTDRLPLSDVGMVASDWQAAAFQTSDLRPERNLWRSVGQPAIIAVATGVTVYLLFNVRSN